MCFLVIVSVLLNSFYTRFSLLIVNSLFILHSCWVNLKSIIMIPQSIVLCKGLQLCIACFPYGFWEGKDCKFETNETSFTFVRFFVKIRQRWIYKNSTLPSAYPFLIYLNAGYVKGKGFSQCFVIIGWPLSVCI